LPIRRLSWSEGVRRGFPELKTLSVQLPVNRTACTDCGEYLPCIYVTAVMLTFWPPPDRSRVFACKLTMFVRLTLCPRLDSRPVPLSLLSFHPYAPTPSALALPELQHPSSSFGRLSSFLASSHRLCRGFRTKALSGSSRFRQNVTNVVFKILSRRCRCIRDDTWITRGFT